jgi:serine/threonine protein kinase
VIVSSNADFPRVPNPPVAMAANANHYAVTRTTLDARAREWSFRGLHEAHWLMAQHGPHLPDGVREGETFLRRYRIGPVLGWGSMGTVVAARHLYLDRKVAIKFLRAEAVDHSQSRQRFYREARAADRIASKHVVRVFDVGTLETGEPYIVMEHLDGCDLATWLGDRGPLPLAEAADFIVQTCEAIGQAHEYGIVHRDLKPANIFVVHGTGEPPAVKVLDFGIAKHTGHMSATLDPSDAVTTDEKVLIGTPFYMSPEQLSSSRDVDARTDIWALGVILFQLLTGHLPFEGTFLELCGKVTAPFRPRQRFPNLSPAAEAVILRCLEPDRERRYSTARELADAVRAFGSSGSPPASPRAHPPIAIQEWSPTLPSQTPPGPRRPVQPPTATSSAQSSRNGRGLAFATLVGTAAVATAFAFGGRKAAPERAPDDAPESSIRPRVPEVETAPPAREATPVERPLEIPVAVSTSKHVPIAEAPPVRPAPPKLITIPPRAAPASSAPANAVDAQAALAVPDTSWPPSSPK